RGGLLYGASHANGGIDLGNGYEAEGGEYIINKINTRRFLPLIKSINDYPTGIQNTQNQGFIDYDLLSTKIANANRSLPTPQVSVSEINSVSNKVSVIENRAVF